jgi:predicted  nucleic acid-binding Zn-ribbon protein
MIKFTILLLCVILPPVLYTASVQLLEQYAHHRVQTELEKTYIGEIQPLLNGSQRIQTAIQHNVDTFLKQNRWIAWGAKAVVTVRTRDNTLLYPNSDLQDPLATGADLQPVEIAAENYRLLNENPAVSMEFRLPYDSQIPITILAALILSSVTLLCLYYRRWKRQYQHQLDTQARSQQHLARKSQDFERQLHTLEAERNRLGDEVHQMQTRLTQARQQADDSEEEMLEEMIALEEKIAEKKEQQNKQQDSIADLQTKIDQLESQLEKEQSRKTKSSDSTRKRLTTLYKNLEISDKAITGYLDLTEDQKIKCEEIIHQLNADPTLVPIKRKVFGKKNRQTVFEIIFAYKGRLYYRPTATKIEIVTIGTKNTQQQDLNHLNHL